MGSSSKSKTVSKPVLLPEQKRIWEYFGSNIIPMAEGQETALSRQLMQAAQDSSAAARAVGEQNIMDMAGRAGMGSAQIAGLLKDEDRRALEATIKAMTTSRSSIADRALQMISGMPIGPGQQSKTTSSSGPSPTTMAAGAVLGAASGGLGAATAGEGVLTGAAGGAASGALGTISRARGNE